LNDFSVTISPRFYETDALGHINNASITAWFEVVRVRYLESLRHSDFSAAKDWILAALQVDFVAETFYGTDVVAKITAARAGNSSLTILCEMFQQERLTVKGKAVLVYMDSANKTPMRIPDTLREQIAHV
jgi:acyl-CoA thioester hydrolase